MGDDAVIVEGVDGPAARAALYSTVHGAGRVFGRKEAKRRFSHAEMDAWLRQRGVTLVGAPTWTKAPDGVPPFARGPDLPCGLDQGAAHAAAVFGCNSRRRGVRPVQRLISSARDGLPSGGGTLERGRVLRSSQKLKVLRHFT